jgi:hypothetical protein
MSVQRSAVLTEVFRGFHMFRLADAATALN